MASRYYDSSIFYSGLELIIKMALVQKSIQNLTRNSVVEIEIYLCRSNS